MESRNGLSPTFSRTGMKRGRNCSRGRRRAAGLARRETGNLSSAQGFSSSEDEYAPSYRSPLHTTTQSSARPSGDIQKTSFQRLSSPADFSERDPSLSRTDGAVGPSCEPVSGKLSVGGTESIGWPAETSRSDSSESIFSATAGCIVDGLSGCRNVAALERHPGQLECNTARLESSDTSGLEHRSTLAPGCTTDGEPVLGNAPGLGSSSTCRLEFGGADGLERSDTCGPQYAILGGDVPRVPRGRRTGGIQSRASGDLRQLDADVSNSSSGNAVSTRGTSAGSERQFREGPARENECGSSGVLGKPERDNAKSFSRSDRCDFSAETVLEKRTETLSREERSNIPERSEESCRGHSQICTTAKGSNENAAALNGVRVLSPEQERVANGSIQGHEKSGDSFVPDALDAFMNTLDFSKPGSRRSRVAMVERLDEIDLGETMPGSGVDVDSGVTSSRHMQSPALAPHPGHQALLHGATTEVPENWSDYDDDDDVSAMSREQTRLEKKCLNELVLPAVDHASVMYPPIARDVYIPLAKFRAIPQDDVRRMCSALETEVSGSSSLQAPIDRFQDLALTLPKSLLGILLGSYRNPTVVQRVSLPQILAGNNVIVTAETGSGKTLAYILPFFAHIQAQSRRSIGVGGSGPTAVVVAPTRELAGQIASVARKFATGMDIGVACVIGGYSKYEQFKQLRDGRIAVVICTPGRFIDLLRMKACSLTSVTYAVVDEADRMFDMGFGPQVKTILEQFRPDAHKVFVSATFPETVRDVCKLFIGAAVRISVSSRRHVALRDSRHTSATESLRDTPQDDCHAAYVERPHADENSSAVALIPKSITETYIIVRSESERFQWVLNFLPGLMNTGKIITFCGTRGGAAELSNELRKVGLPTGCLHGELEERDRVELMNLFRHGDVRLLVSTDIASRGLDIEGVRTVVNFEPAKNWEDHVHRSGRTGRAGTDGEAITLLNTRNAKDAGFIHSAWSSLRAANVSIPAVLHSARKEIQLSARKDHKRPHHRKRMRSGFM